MREADVNDNERMARAKEAAELLFNAEDASAVDIYEPRNSLEANAAGSAAWPALRESPRHYHAGTGSCQRKRGLAFQRPASGPRQR